MYRIEFLCVRVYIYLYRSLICMYKLIYAAVDTHDEYER